MPSFASPAVKGPAQAAEPQPQQEADLLRTVDPHRRVHVQFSDISAYVQVLVTPGAGAPAHPSEGEAEAGEGNKTQNDVEAGTKQQEGAEGAAPKERQVLFNISGCAQPGEMLALMGPSGSGKSSLLTVLGGRNRARIGGTLRFNGQPVNKMLKRRMGFVTQDDLLFAELTTFETLYYAALLRLPKTWTRTQKEERVNMVLRGLGLDKCRDTIIGNHMMRGVSGGERKRVSIGHELLINPSVILLDEPTSGLDSTTALKLIQTLRNLASGGRTIIASIHQPSSRLYQEFDKLMLLSEGYCMYYGDAHASAHWFALQGVPVPFGVSMPDHLLDLACGDLTGGASPAEAKALQRRLADAFEHRAFGTGEHGVQPEDFGTAASGVVVADRATHERQKALDLPVDSATTDLGATEAGSSARTSPADTLRGIAVKSPRDNSNGVGASVHANSNGNAVVPVGKSKSRHSLGGSRGGSDSSDDEGDETPAAQQQPGGKQRLPAESKWGASWFEQVAILTSRCLRVRRFQSLSIQRFVEVTLVAILAGLFWFQVGGKNQLTDQSIADINGLLFFMVLFTSFSTLFSALFTFPADFQILIKERQSGMYRLSAYYAARIVSDIPMDCFIPSIFFIIIYFMGGLRLAAGSFFCNWLSMLLTMLVAQSLGLFLSATISDNKTLLSITTVIMLATMLIAGFYVQNVPVWIAWAKYLSFIRYGYILMQQVEFGNGRGYSCADYYKDNPNAPPGLTWCPATASPALPGEISDPVTTQVCVLLAFLIAFRIAVYISLSRRTTFKVKTS